MDTDLEQIGADVIVNLLPDLRVSPYLLAGWHEVQFESEDPAVPESKFNGWQAAAGAKVYLHPRAALRLEARNAFWRFDAPPAPDPPGEDYVHSWFFTGSV